VSPTPPGPLAHDANTLLGLVTAASREFADAPGLYTTDGIMTRAEVTGAATAIASALYQLGVRQGDRVVIALDNSPEVFLLEQALFLHGIARVGLAGRLEGNEVLAIARDCSASLVVCEDRHIGNEDWRSTGAAVFTRSGAAGVGRLSELMTAPGEPFAVEPVTGDDIAGLMYTSGSTGRPKGAVQTQRSWAAMLTGILAEVPPVSPGDVVLHYASMSHFSGSVGLAFSIRGAATATTHGLKPLQVLEAADRLKATCLPAVPTLLKDLTSAALETGQTTPSLQVLPYGGAAISPAALRRAQTAFGKTLVQLYGLSEALMPVTALNQQEHADAIAAGDDAVLASAGHVGLHNDIRLDPRPELTNVPGAGEILIKGANVMAGYWNSPTQTAEALTADGWFRTGDIGVFDGSGRLTIVDRAKEMIVSGGFNIFPAEVERVIETLPGVLEVAVVAAPHDRWGEGVCAVVVRSPEAGLSSVDVIDWCRSRLASYKKPVRVDFVPALPRTGTGKINRAAVRDGYWSGDGRRIGE
jgi:acyl-CoA synthetase (AMP-forming)/AMP-acid ligase II